MLNNDNNAFMEYKNMICFFFFFILRNMYTNCMYLLTHLQVAIAIDFWGVMSIGNYFPT